jgi:hypothetical protein
MIFRISILGAALVLSACSLNSPTHVGIERQKSTHNGRSVLLPKALLVHIRLTKNRANVGFGIRFCMGSDGLVAGSIHWLVSKNLNLAV